MLKPIIINFHNGSSNVIVTDKNDVVSYPPFSGTEISTMVNAVKVNYPQAATFYYVPEDVANTVIKQIDVYSTAVSGTEVPYPLFLGEKGLDRNVVAELVNFVNSI